MYPATILWAVLSATPMGLTQNKCKAFRAAIQTKWMDVPVDQASLVMPVL